MRDNHGYQNPHAMTDQERDELARQYAEALVMAIAIGAPIHRDKDGNGPKHCPVVIWEDSVSDWYDHL